MAEEDRMLAVQKAAKKAEKDNRRLEREVSFLFLGQIQILLKQVPFVHHFGA